MAEKGKQFLQPRQIGILIAVILAAASMLYFRFSRVAVFPTPFAARFTHEINYQFLTFMLLLVLIAISVALGGKKSIAVLYPCRFDAPVTPVPILGINTRGDETWKQVGISMLIIITLVTATAIYFQVFRGKEVDFSVSRVILPALGFSIINSLVEEGLFRFSIVSVFLSTGGSARKAAILSGVLFGGVHYFGNPGGIPGVFLAAFLGWFLAKSVAETRSIGWAWLIHCVQDIVIFSALFASGALPE